MIDVFDHNLSTLASDTPHSACSLPFSSFPRDKFDVELALTRHRLFVLYVLAGSNQRFIFVIE
jgi:hypothetical protein